MSDQYFINRQNKLRELLAKNNLDGMLVTNLVHIRYLCGFTGSAGSLVLTHNRCDFITDGNYDRFIRNGYSKFCKEFQRSE